MKKLPRHARVLVADGGRALIFRNEGSAPAPELRLERSVEHDVPPTRDLGRDKPPRTNDAAGRRSAHEKPDLHQIEEDRFIVGLVTAMDEDLRAGVFDALVVVAPPVALGEYRKAATPALQAATIMEIAKDLTKHRPEDIAKLVVKALEDA